MSEKSDKYSVAKLGQSHLPMANVIDEQCGGVNSDSLML